jgi:hypothetical protein
MPAGGFKAFSVKDEVNPLDKAASSNDAAKQTAPVKEQAPAAVDKRPAKIEIQINQGEKPEVVWDRYFAKTEPQPKAVRVAVRRLMGERKFDHVVALIGAALRNRQCQPWMYEALALALDAAGRPKADVERAIMSAVDFVDNSTDMMYIANYLSRMGMNDRAIEVYRQASHLDPLRPEPYMLGLKAARAANSLEGLKWASLGILGQAWPKEQASVWQAGMGVAKEVLDKLRAEKRDDEADHFLAACKQAVARDCVAIVTWTGDADVDVSVKEPTGTICSLRNPRTIGGGILLDDAIRQIGRDSLGGRSAVYVCPKGFDGEYQLLARRVWGSVATGKINVEVITHDLTSHAIDVRKRIALDKDEAVVAFSLKDGRRKEPLAEQQVANAAGAQLAVNRQILAQQLAAAADPQSMSDLAQARLNGGGLGAQPFLGAGAIGYQPIIMWLPSGANCMMSAVVSADRRYVRVTVNPIFSGVSKVDTFNTSSGATGTQGGNNNNTGNTGAGFSPSSGGGSGGGSGIGSGGIR